MYVLEVQGSAQAEFAERMFVYHYRLFDRYRQPVASLALLADTTASWRPTQFGYQALGCSDRVELPPPSCWITLPIKTSCIKIPTFRPGDSGPFADPSHRQDMNARFAAKWNWCSCCISVAGINNGD